MCECAQLLFYLHIFVQLVDHAGRENTETRGDGNVCDSASYHVLYHVGPPNPKGNTVLIVEHNYSHDSFTCDNPTFMRS